MNKLWLGATAIILAACGNNDNTTTGPQSSPDTGGPSTPLDFSAVGTTLDTFLSANPIALSGAVTGYSFALTSKTGVLYQTSGGNQDVTTVSAIASATKVPSAIAILTLVDAGKLGLDEPVKTYFDALDPSFNWPQDKWAITTRMLLSHTAGLPQPPDPTSSDCLSNTFTTLQSCVQDIATHDLIFPPGTTFSYSGADYQIAGYVAELISGTAWESFFDSAVAQPLKLTTFTYGSTDNPRLAGGGSTDIEDYAAILRMLLNDGVADDGTRVLSHAMVQALKTNQIGNATVEPLPFLGTDQQAYFAPEYTFGFFVTAPSLYASTGSPGPEFDDPGLFGTTPWLDAGLGYAAIILITQDVPTGLSMWNAVRPMVTSQLIH